MRILNSNELNVTPAGARDDQHPPYSRITVSGHSSAVVVAGAVVEAAISWRSHYLIFMTDDIPYEDALSIHLLTTDFALLDSATLSSIYATGSFSDLNLIEPNTVEFRFIGDTDWRVELLRNAELRVPFFSEPRGVRRKLGFRRQFRVLGNPRPASD